MIVVTLATCSEDKPATSVTDPLISTQAMALKRAAQELADHMMIVKRRTLQMPLELYEPGDLIPFSLSKLQIDGMHKVETWSLSVSLDKIYVSGGLSQGEVMCRDQIS